jgi:hypothetical protein
MAVLIAFSTHANKYVQKTRLDTCLHDKEIELYISLATGHMILTFRLRIREKK